MPSRKWRLCWDLAIWSGLVFVKAHFINHTYCIRPAFLLLSVALIDVLAGTTDDGLLHVHVLL